MGIHCIKFQVVHKYFFEIKNKEKFNERKKNQFLKVSMTIGLCEVQLSFFLCCGLVRFVK